MREGDRVAMAGGMGFNVMRVPVPVGYAVEVRNWCIRSRKRPRRYQTAHERGDQLPRLNETGGGLTGGPGKRSLRSNRWNLKGVKASKTLLTMPTLVVKRREKNRTWFKRHGLHRRNSLCVRDHRCPTDCTECTLGEMRQGHHH